MRQQVQSYSENGFLLVPGLVAQDVVGKARRIMLERIGNMHSGSHHVVVNDPSVLACFSRQVCAAAEHIVGAPGRFVRPNSTYTISVFPQDASWRWPAPHIDHALEADAHRTFPSPYHIGCLVYLTEVSTRAGATVVWPGSHLQLESLAKSNPAQYEYLWVLNRDIPKIQLAEPAEVLAGPGDVLFYHYLCAHAGSVNTGSGIRLALNHKW